MQKTFTIEIPDQAFEKCPSIIEEIDQIIRFKIFKETHVQPVPDSGRLTAAVDRICAKLQKMYPGAAPVVD